MKILIISDTHGSVGNLEKVLKKVAPIDHLIHLGDVEGQEEQIAAMAGVPVSMVAGNNDWFCELPKQQLIMLGKYRVFLTHGHRYGVHGGHEGLRQQAALKRADIVMYGHTHYPCVEQKPGLTILNPGSLSLPRQHGHRPSYIVMEIDREGEAHYHIGFLKENVLR
ncbi:MAG: metallophosphoesterase [Lachnospiraceae bacterium]|nr:metallophosphoesterase [Lachnospiraceae bacterium]